MAPIFKQMASPQEPEVFGITSLLSVATIDEDVTMEDVASQHTANDIQQPPMNSVLAHATAADAARIHNSAQRLANFAAALSRPPRQVGMKDPADRTASTMRESKWADPAPRTPVAASRRDSIHSLASHTSRHSVLEHQLPDTKWTPKSQSERKVLAAERQAAVDKVIRDRQIKQALESSPQPATTASSSPSVTLNRIEQFRLDMLGVQPSVSKDKTSAAPVPLLRVPVLNDAAETSVTAVISSPASQAGITPQPTLSISATPTLVNRVQRQVLNGHTSMRKDSAVGIAETKNTRPIAQAHRHPVSAGLITSVSNMARSVIAVPPTQECPVSPTSPTKRVASAAVPTMPPPKRLELEKPSFQPFDENQAIEMSMPSTPAVKATSRRETTAAAPKSFTSTDVPIRTLAGGTARTSPTTRRISQRPGLASSPQPLTPNQSGPARTYTPVSATTSNTSVARRRRIATVRIFETQAPTNSAPNSNGGLPEPASSPQSPLTSAAPAVAEIQAPAPAATPAAPVARRRRIAIVRIVEESIPANPAPVMLAEQTQVRQAVSTDPTSHPIKDLSARQPAPVRNIGQQVLPRTKPIIANHTMVAAQIGLISHPDTAISNPAIPSARPGSSTAKDIENVIESAIAPVRAASMIVADQSGTTIRPYPFPSGPVAPDARDGTTPINTMVKSASPVAASASTASIPTKVDEQSTSPAQTTIRQAPAATALPSPLTRPRRKIATVRIVGENSSLASSLAEVATTSHTPSHTRDNSTGLVSGFQRLSLSPPPSAKTTSTIYDFKNTKAASATKPATNPLPAAPVEARASYATTSRPLRDTSSPLRQATANLQQAESTEAAYFAKTRSTIAAKAAKSNPRSISSTLRAQTASSPAEDAKLPRQILFDKWAEPVDRGRPGKLQNFQSKQLHISKLS